MYSLLLIVDYLKELADFGSFICVCILVSMSRENPFESHYIGNLSNYFYGEVNNALFESVGLEEKILNGSRNISLIVDKKKLFLRKLVSKSFCSEIHDDFQKYKGTQLSNIFDLNYGKIHKISIAALVIYCVKIFFSFYGILLSINRLSITNKRNFCQYSIILILLIVTKLILSIILFYFMEKGDIEKYDNFLDCKNVKIKVFKKITDINKLRGCFFAFVILNIINIGIEKLDGLLEKIYDPKDI